MAEFLTLADLETKITDLIFNAKRELLILSPYIKLDDYFKTLFSNHLKNPDVHIILVFGKNEDDKGKSLRNDDFEFLKQFPNISILYLKNLHAKYYANEEEGIVTSINLHDYSFKNNIEFGIRSKNPETSILGLGTVKNPFGDNLDSSAWDCAYEFAMKAEVVFIKRPVVQKKLFGLSTNHMGSEVLFDNTDFFAKSIRTKKLASKAFEDFPDQVLFGKPLLQEKPTREDVQVEVKSRTSTKYENKSPNNNSSNSQLTAFCIRTGERIKFNIYMPYSDSAFSSWKNWGNEDYSERFCHSCGKPAPTSKRKPTCDSCYYKVT